MTDLLLRPRTSRNPPAEGARRPLWLSAGLAGATAAGSVLLGCLALALVGWFASDAGSHGDTRDALRVGADAWLLGHGSGLTLVSATIGIVPLGLTALCLYVTHRLGRWAAETSEAEDLPAVGLGVVVLAGVYGVVALLTAVLASDPVAQPSLGRSFLGGCLVGLVGGGLGVLRGSAAGRELRSRLPETVVAVLRGGIAAAALVLAAGSVLVVSALLLDLGTAANVLSRLHADAAGGALYTTLVAALAPNVALLGSAYLLGPGFAVGTGTLVAPTTVTLGPVPAFPLLAALPAEGPGPAWAAALVAVPVFLGLVTGVLTLRRHPARGWETAAVRGLGAGLLGGLLTTLLVALAGGSVGPGRMADVGAPLLDVLVAATLALGVGALVGGLGMTWWTRRHSAEPADEVDPSTEDTVRL